MKDLLPHFFIDIFWLFSDAAALSQKNVNT
jgi:hypothetical protein